MIIPFICGVAVWIIVYHRVSIASLRLDALMTDDITMPVIEKEQRSDKHWNKFRRNKIPRSGFQALEKKSLSAWRADIYDKYGPKAQMMVSGMKGLWRCFSKVSLLIRFILWVPDDRCC
jgi:hypothetical protein